MLQKTVYKIKSVHIDTAAPDGESVGIVRLENELSVLEEEPSSLSDSAPFQFVLDAVAIAKQAARTINTAASPEDFKILNATAENVQ